MDARGIDTEPGWENRRFQKIERMIEALRSERRAAATTISDGDLRLANGAQLVVDGGDVVMLDTDGSALFRLGLQANGDRGVSVFREDGSIALAIRKAFPSSGAQSVEIRDRLGNLIVAEEALGSGMSRPFLHIPMVPVIDTATALPTGPYGPEVPVTAATFTTTHRAWFARHNQYGRFMVQIAASDATTAAEVRIINAATNTVLGDFLAGPWLGVRAAGSTTHVQVDPPRIFLPGAPDERVSVAVQVRRTAGTGTLSVALPESHGS